MNGLNSYLELVEHGRPMDEVPTPPAVQEPLLRLLAHAHEQEELPVEGAWRLDSRVSRTLEKRHASSPPGGWAGLAGLACGCGVLRAQREAFEPDMELAELVARDEAQVRRELFEAFTRLLVPPAAAAGLFIIIGMHPAWGLRVAHETHARGRSEFTGRPPAGIEPGWRDESLFPDAVVELLGDTIFGAIAAVVATLRKLSPAERYPIDALAGLVQQSCYFSRRCAQEQYDRLTIDGLTPFVGELADDGRAGSYRVLDFATVDLLDTLMVPAGIARRFDDGTFCVFEDVLEGVRVGDLDADAQEVKLTWLLAGEAGCLVA